VQETRPSADYSIGVALEAKLFGRIKLLTIDATVDVVQSPGRKLLVPDERLDHDGEGVHRADVEAVIGEARQVIRQGVGSWNGVRHVRAISAPR